MSNNHLKQQIFKRFITVFSALCASLSLILSQTFLAFAIPPQDVSSVVPQGIAGANNEEQALDLSKQDGTSESIDIDAAEYSLSGKEVHSYEQDVRAYIPSADCPRAAIFDANGNFVFGKNAHEKVKIASVTKIMTAIIASSFNLEEEVVVTPLAAYTTGSSANIIEGDVTNLRELMKGLMLPSGNDAAYAIAGFCGKKMLESEEAIEDSQDENKCIDRFIVAMNDKARELGMFDSLFCNPCGLDDEGFEGEHVSSAYDVALMTMAAYENDIIRDTVDKTSDVLKCVRSGVEYSLPMTNTNRLLLSNEDAVGMKTGFTDQAGNCVACVFEDDGIDEPDEQVSASVVSQEIQVPNMKTFTSSNDASENNVEPSITANVNTETTVREKGTYFISVLGSPTADDSFIDGSTLYDWVKTSRVSRDLIKGLEGRNVNGGINMGSIGHRDWLERSFAIEAQLPEEYKYSKYAWDDDWTLESVVESDTWACGEISAGDFMGYVKVLDENGETIEKYNIVSSEDVEKPAWHEDIAIFLVRLWYSITGSGADYAADEINELTRNI